jgi:hypothetical protein
MARSVGYLDLRVAGWEGSMEARAVRKRAKKGKNNQMSTTKKS